MNNKGSIKQQVAAATSAISAASALSPGPAASMLSLVLGTARSEAGSRQDPVSKGFDLDEEIKTRLDKPKEHSNLSQEDDIVQEKWAELDEVAMDFRSWMEGKSLNTFEQFVKRECGSRKRQNNMAELNTATINESNKKLHRLLYCAAKNDQQELIQMIVEVMGEIKSNYKLGSIEPFFVLRALFQSEKLLSEKNLNRILLKSDILDFVKIKDFENFWFKMFEIVIAKGDWAKLRILLIFPIIFTSSTGASSYASAAHCMKKAIQSNRLDIAYCLFEKDAFCDEADQEIIEFLHQASLKNLRDADQFDLMNKGQELRMGRMVARSLCPNPPRGGVRVSKTLVIEKLLDQSLAREEEDGGSFQESYYFRLKSAERYIEATKAFTYPMLLTYITQLEALISRYKLKPPVRQDSQGVYCNEIDANDLEELSKFPGLDLSHPQQVLDYIQKGGDLMVRHAQFPQVSLFSAIILFSNDYSKDDAELLLSALLVLLKDPGNSGIQNLSPDEATLSLNFARPELKCRNIMLLSNSEFVDFLLQHQADPNKPVFLNGLELKSVLADACRLGLLEIVKLLVENGADVNKPDLSNGGDSPLNLAMGCDDSLANSIIVYLISQNADITQTNYQGRSSLEHALSRGHKLTLKTLLSEFDNELESSVIATKQVEVAFHLVFKSIRHASPGKEDYSWALDLFMDNVGIFEFKWLFDKGCQKVLSFVKDQAKDMEFKKRIRGWISKNGAALASDASINEFSYRLVKRKANWDAGKKTFSFPLARVDNTYLPKNLANCIGLGKLTTLTVPEDYVFSKISDLANGSLPEFYDILWKGSGEYKASVQTEAVKKKLRKRDLLQPPVTSDEARESVKQASKLFAAFNERKSSMGSLLKRLSEGASGGSKFTKNLDELAETIKTRDGRILRLENKMDAEKDADDVNTLKNFHDKNGEVLGNINTLRQDYLKILDERAQKENAIEAQYKTKLDEINGWKAQYDALKDNAALREGITEVQITKLQTQCIDNIKTITQTLKVLHKEYENCLSTAEALSTRLEGIARVANRLEAGQGNSLTTLEKTIPARIAKRKEIQKYKERLEKGKHGSRAANNTDGNKDKSADKSKDKKGKNKEEPKASPSSLPSGSSLGSKASTVSSESSTSSSLSGRRSSPVGSSSSVDSEDKEKQEQVATDRAIKIEIYSNHPMTTSTPLVPASTTTSAMIVEPLSSMAHLQWSTGRFRSQNIIGSLLKNESIKQEIKKAIQSELDALNAVLEEPIDPDNAHERLAASNSVLQLTAQIMGKMTSSYIFPIGMRKTFRNAVYNRKQLLIDIGSDSNAVGEMARQFLSYVNRCLLSGSRATPPTVQEVTDLMNSPVFNRIIASGVNKPWENLSAKEALTELETSIETELEAYRQCQAYEEAIPLSLKYAKDFTEGRQGKYLKRLRSELNDKSLNTAEYPRAKALLATFKRSDKRRMDGKRHGEGHPVSHKKAASAKSSTLLAFEASSRRAFPMEGDEDIFSYSSHSKGFRMDDKTEDKEHQEALRLLTERRLRLERGEEPVKDEGFPDDLEKGKEISSEEEAGANASPDDSEDWDLSDGLGDGRTDSPNPEVSDDESDKKSVVESMNTQSSSLPLSSGSETVLLDSGAIMFSTTGFSLAGCSLVPYQGAGRNASSSSLSSSSLPSSASSKQWMKKPG